MKPFTIMTALITPFKGNGKIDYDALGRLIDEQIEQGIDGFIICGTTAETPALKEHERFDVLRYVIERSKHQVELWFGCGTNVTRDTLRLVKKASYYDIDGVLLVTPYYNKPSQNGLYAHFRTIADAADIPIMLYQVPSRCGVAMEEKTILRLVQDCPNIKALKFASDDYEMIAHLSKQVPALRIFSGEDKTFMKGMEKGLCGLVSVLSNYALPVIQTYIKEPSKEHYAYLEQLAALTFLECSPSAIKYMMSKEKKCQNIVRLPLVPLSIPSKRQIDAFLSCDKTRQPL